MNTAMVRRLVQKDWAFQRRPIFAAFVAGVLALVVLGLGTDGAFYAGSVLLITIVIGLGIYLVIATVLQERTEKTITFVMSLPVTVHEYTAAKLIANLLLYLVPWAALGIGVTIVTLTRSGIPDGLLPFVALMLFELLVSYVLVLAVALVSESMGWTVGAIVFCNLFMQGFMYAVSHNPDIAASMVSNTIVWHRQTILILISELVIAALLLAITWCQQARKTDFI